MSLIEIDFRPDEKTLRQFGWIALGGFGLLATLSWFELLVFSFGLGAARLPVTAGFAAVGCLAALFSLVAPKANRPIYVTLAVIALPIGFVLSYVILGTIFYLLITPVALAFTLTRRDSLRRAFPTEAESCWVDAPPARPRERYFRQF